MGHLRAADDKSTRLTLQATTFTTRSTVKYIKKINLSGNLKAIFTIYTPLTAWWRQWRSLHLQTSSTRRLRLWICVPSRSTLMSIWTNIWVRFRWQMNSLFPPAARRTLSGHLLLFSFLLGTEEERNTKNILTKNSDIGLC